MRIPDDVKECVGYIGHAPVTEVQDFDDYVGTAFMVQVFEHGAPFLHLVTAQHVLDDLRTSPYKHKFCRVNDHTGKARNLPLKGLKWYNHPTQPYNVDVAISLLPFDEMLVGACIMPTMFLTQPELEARFGIGDEVFAVGLFKFSYGKKSNSPIARVGHLAMIPKDLVESEKRGPMEAYLIEARSIGAMSGAPVFIWQTRRLMALSAGFLHGSFALLGSVQGYLKLKEGEKLNVGLSLVTPGHKIWETLYQPALQKERKKRAPKVKAAYEKLRSEGALEAVDAVYSGREEENAE